MRDERCLSCQMRISRHEREATVKKLANVMAAREDYPYIFSLLSQLQLCSPCMQQLPVITESCCQGCGRQMDELRDRQSLCSDCQTVQRDLSVQNRSCLRYTPWTKAMVSRWKYRGDERMSEFFAALLVMTYYRYYKPNGVQLITYVPLHPERLLERGFNQAEVLAALLASKLKLPVHSLLVRTKNTMKQSKQSGKKARVLSMENAFQPDRASSSQKPCQKILLIDDIYTTGATIRYCAQAVRTIPEYSHAVILSMTISR